MVARIDPGDKAIWFIQGLCHAKGRWAGEPFTLMDWQRERVVKPLFGTIRPDGTRQYRQCLVAIPRKNGKSSLAAAIALYMLCADGEKGGEIYGAAVDRDQASIVFDTAAAMVRATPKLRGHLEIIDSRKRIVNPKTGSFYRVIAADAAGSHGFNASCVLLDEAHAQPNRDLLDVLVTSTGARTQPLIFVISTAGYDRNSAYYELFDYARKVESGVVVDPTFLPVLYGADEGDDWLDPAVWRKANPSLDVTITEEYLAQEFKRAQETPAYENVAKRLFLNIWTRQETRWLPLAAWDECGGALQIEPGQGCYAGLDLASTTDIAALVLVFPQSDGTYDVLPHFWVPGDNIEARVRRDRVPYDVWERQGLLTATPGNVIDYKAIMVKFDQLAQEYDIREVGFDRWGATQLVQDMQEAGLEVVPIGQGFASMSAPTKELLNLVLGKKIRHGGNPILRWMADSMIVKQDPAGNIKPDKEKSTERIDGMVALAMGIDRATRHEHGASKYETEDLAIL